MAAPKKKSTAKKAAPKKAAAPKKGAATKKDAAKKKAAAPKKAAAKRKTTKPQKVRVEPVNAGSELDVFTAVGEGPFDFDSMSTEEQAAILPMIQLIGDVAGALWELDEEGVDPADFLDALPDEEQEIYLGNASFVLGVIEEVGWRLVGVDTVRELAKALEAAAKKKDFEAVRMLAGELADLELARYAQGE